jgi:hypothetical protein
VETAAQGWYRDPYAVHEDRYFSAGKPTKLVRDAGREAYDPPPDLPLPAGELVPAVRIAAAGAADGPVPPTLGEKMHRALFDYFDQLPNNN